MKVKIIDGYFDWMEIPPSRNRQAHPDIYLGGFTNRLAAAYSPEGNYIIMYDISTKRDAEWFISTFVHEIAHWCWFREMSDAEIRRHIDHRQMLAQLCRLDEMERIVKSSEDFADYVSIDCRSMDVFNGANATRFRAICGVIFAAAVSVFGRFRSQVVYKFTGRSPE